jgi:hypothetical protein
MTDAQRKALQDYALVNVVGKDIDNVHERHVENSGRRSDRLMVLQSKLAKEAGDALAELLKAFGA